MKRRKIFAVSIIVILCLIIIVLVNNISKEKGTTLFGFTKPEDMTIEMEIGSVRNKVERTSDKEKFISYLNNLSYKKVSNDVIDGVGVIYINSENKKWEIGIAGTKIFYKGKCYKMDKDVYSEMRALAGF